MLRLILSLCCAALSCAASSDQELAGALPLFPAAKGWNQDEAPQAFPGEKLWELIDGGAAILNEYGVLGAVTSRYTNAKGRSVLVELYVMKDEAAAYGIYSLNARTLKRRLALGEDSAASTDYVLLRKGKIYASFTSVSRDAPSVDACIDLALILSEGLPPSRASFKRPAPPLPSLGKETPVVFIRGSIGLLNLYPFGARDPFSLREGRAAQQGDNLFFALSFSSPEEAAARLDAAWENLSKNPKFRLDGDPARERLLRDDKDRFLLLRPSASELLIAIGPKPEALRRILSGQ